MPYDGRQENFVVELNRRQIYGDLHIARPSRGFGELDANTQSPMGTMSPVSSAIGMKSSGGIMPRSGWCQRISASKPVTYSVFISTKGW